MKQLILNAQDGIYFEHLYAGNLENAIGNDTLALGMLDEESVPPRAVGLLLAQVQGRGLVINWLYVEKEYRHKGVATTMVERLLGVAAKEEQLDQAVAFVSAGQHELLRFLDHFGFGIMFHEGWGEFKGTLGNMIHIPQTPIKEYTVISLKEVQPGGLKEFQHRIFQSNIDCGVPLPIHAEDYDPASVVCLKGNEIVGIALLRMDEDEVRIPWFYAEHGDAKAYVSMLQKLVSTVKEQLPPDTPLTIGTCGRTGERAAEHVLPDAQWSEVYIAGWIL